MLRLANRKLFWSWSILEPAQVKVTTSRSFYHFLSVAAAPWAPVKRNTFLDIQYSEQRRGFCVDQTTNLIAGATMVPPVTPHRLALLARTGHARIDVLLPSPPIIRYPLIYSFLSERASSAACRRMASVSNESCQSINELSHWPWQVLAGSWVWCLCLELSAWVYITISHYELLLSIQFRSVISADMFANSESKEGKNGSTFYITRPAFMVWYYFRFFVYLKF